MRVDAPSRFRTSSLKHLLQLSSCEKSDVDSMGPVIYAICNSAETAPRGEQDEFTSRGSMGKQIVEHHPWVCHKLEGA